MPLTTSNNLDLVPLVTGQASPETTANDKGGELDSFLTAVKAVSVSGGNATVSATDYKRYRSYRITGNTTGGRSVTLQALSRAVLIDNSDAGNTQSIAIILGSTTLNLAVGKKGFYQTDGTANGLELIISNDASTLAAAPDSADYLVKTANGSLSAERVVTDTGGITWDWSTGGQAKAVLSVTLTIAASDESTALTTGTGKVTFRMPHAMTVTEVRGSLSTAQATGSVLTVDINEAGTSIISTKLTFDNTEKTTTTAATPAVISDASLADDAEITIDIDQVGDGTAKGLKVTLIGTR